MYGEREKGGRESADGEKEGKWSTKQHHRVSRPSTLWLWNAKPPIFWLLLWKQLRFPFSKIFFPYLSDPSGEIHLLAMTPASSSKSGTRPAELRHTHIHTHAHTCTPAAQKQTLTADHYSRPLYCLHCYTWTHKANKYMCHHTHQQGHRELPLNTQSTHYTYQD